MKTTVLVHIWCQIASFSEGRFLWERIFFMKLSTVSSYCCNILYSSELSNHSFFDEKLFLYLPNGLFLTSKNGCLRASSAVSLLFGSRVKHFSSRSFKLFTAFISSGVFVVVAAINIAPMSLVGFSEIVIVFTYFYK